MIIILAPHFCAKGRTTRMNAIDAMLKEPLNKSRAGATMALRDEMRERRRREWLFPFARSLTKQTARKAPSHAGCGKIGCSLRYSLAS
jgi:hypothetical protein